MSAETVWGPAQIRARGLKLLAFMEKRWLVPFRGEKDKLAMLFPKLVSESEIEQGADQQAKE